MPDEGYEELNPAIPAFPTASGGPADPPPSAGGIPNFPTASHGSAVPPSEQAAAADNKKAASMQDKPSQLSKMGASQAAGLKNNKSKMSKNSKMSKKGNTSAMEESRMGGATEGSSFKGRPNTCDTCQMAITLFISVLVIAISIPVLLAATGNVDIKFVREALMELD